MNVRRALPSALVCVLALSPLRAGAQGPAVTPQPSIHTADPTVSEAERLMNDGHFPQAESMLRNELLAHPRNADAMYALAYCLLRQDHAADALRQYTAAAAIRPPSSTELINVGLAYVLLGDDVDADKWTLQALRADPKSVQGWYSLGRIRYTDQRFTEAAACFGHVLKLSPHNVKAENNLGLAYEGLNRTDDAVAAYRQAIDWQKAAAPDQASEQPLLNLSIVLLHRGDTAGAEPLLTQAQTLAPADPRVHEQLGHLYLQEAKFDPAAKQFELAIAEDPRNSGLHFLLGQAYRHLGKTQAAEAEFAAARTLAEPSATARTP